MQLHRFIKKDKRMIGLLIMAFVVPVLALRITMSCLHIQSIVIDGEYPMIWLFLVGASSITMLWYLMSLVEKRESDIPSEILFVCALAYGMSSYSILQSARISDHLVIAVFPVLMIFYEQVSDGCIPHLFMAILAFFIAVDPVIGGSLCLLFAIGSGIKILSSQKDQSVTMICIREEKKLLATALSILFSSPFWLPKAYTYLASFGIKWDNPRLYSDWPTLFSRFLILSDESVLLTFDHGSNLYCGVIVLVAVLISAFCEHIPFKRRMRSVLIFVALMLLINIQPIYDVFTFFSKKRELVVCLGFLPVFFLLRTVVLSDIRGIVSMSYKRLLGAFVIIGVLFILISLRAEGYHSNRSVFAMLILLTFYMMLFFFYRRKSIKEKTFVIVFSTALFAELVISSIVILQDIANDTSAFEVYADNYVNGADENVVSKVDPFTNAVYSSPSDLSVGSGLEGLQIIRYDSGIIAYDSHKTTEVFPAFIVTYRFKAEKDGILYIRQGDETIRYGDVKKGEEIVYKVTHISKSTAVEYEYFQTCYMSAKEEELILDGIDSQNRIQQKKVNNGRVIARAIGGLLFVLAGLYLVIEKHARYHMVGKKRCKCGVFFANKCEKKRMYIYAFLIPFIILLFSCICAGIKPFGNNVLWEGDGIALTIPGLLQVRDQILKGKMFYGFTAGGGENLYYLNPAMFLLSWMALIPRRVLPEVLTYVILLKISLCGTSIYAFLSKKHPIEEGEERSKRSIALLALSTSYALSAYQICMSNYYHWTDVVLILPLLLLAMERMMEERKVGWYCLLLSASMIMNCYNTIFICIFLIFWFFMFDFSDIRDLVKKGSVFAVCSVLSAGMAFWVLYATFLSRKAGLYMDSDSGIPTFTKYQSFWKTLHQFFLFADPVSGTGERGMLNLYSGLFVLLLVIYGLITRTKIRRFRYRVAVLVFILLSTNISVLDYVWNGFHNQNNMPGRFAFLVTFLLADLAWDVVNTKQEKIQWLSVTSFSVFSILLTILIACLSDSKQRSAMMTFLWVGGYIVIFVKTWYGQEYGKKDGKTIKLFQVLIFLELILNCCFVFRDFAREINVSSDNEVATWLEVYDPEMTGLDRVAFPGSAGSNKGKSSNLASLGIFNSYLSSWQYYYGASLGMAATNNMIRDSYNLTPVSNALGRVKYICLNRYIEASGIDLDGYKVIGEVGDVIILENTNLLPEGFWINKNTMMRLNETEGREEFINCLSGGINGDNRVFDLAVPMKKIDDRDVFENERIDSSTPIFNPRNSVYENFTETGFRIIIPKDGRYYAGGICYDYLGEFAQDEELSLERIIMQPEIETLLRFNTEAFRAFMQAVKQKGLSDVKVEDGSIQGSIMCDENGYICFPIPYEPGWKAYCNGVQRDIQQMRNGMMAVPVEEGMCNIELKFLPVGLVEGVSVTVVAWILFVLACMIGNKCRQSEGVGSKNVDNREEG